MRFSLFAFFLLTLVALTGCFGGGDDDDGGGDGPPGDEPEPELPSYDPAPMGDALTEQEIQELALVFSDEPLTGGQDPWPSHLLKWISDDVFLLLHMNREDPLEADKVMWWGMGVRGTFCAESQPSPDFTHFHKRSAPTYAEGHGGSGGEEGYWLLHMNVEQFESPFGDTGPVGVHEEFGPTVPPTCGEEYVPPTFDPVGSDSLSNLELQAFNVVFADQPLVGGQQPWPSHLIKWVNNDTFLLMHFDAEDPLQSQKILWMGMGHRSTFCAHTQPDEDFTHFHSAMAPTYAEGHGGGIGQPGYWLLHAATHDFESPFGQTGGPGVDSMFGPTPAETCPDEMPA